MAAAHSMARLARMARLATAFALALGVSASAFAGAERVKDLARFQGVRANGLVGYGLVVGLPGTGDDNLAYTVQSMRSAASALGVQLPPGINPALKNAAAVMITAELPPFAKSGQRIDVTVSALGRAKSLRGGTLLMTPLKGADGGAYALAQGHLTVGGFGADGADGSKVVVNTPTSGRIPGGAIVERPAPSPFGSGEALVLDLHTPSFQTAQAMAQAINRAEGRLVARALDAVSVAVEAQGGASAQVALAGRIEAVEVAVAAPPARVVVNARTGTIVIGGDVRIRPAAISHGNLTVAVSENYRVSQPGPLARRGDTVVTPDSEIAAREEPVRMGLFAPGARLSDIVDAVNALGAAPGDLVAILEALKEAGALRAELVVI
ncbi:flagellar basal body P-ring protein FlgI [Sandaracinobacteroides sp. A072]|uniref:flagellar basal body P-ring protein FlgI n=1 Tax=Sandaracinobacteroides sp. A072 TaxID=3461146 RepID=UPI004042EF06